MQKPVANVFTWPADEPLLLGSRCEGCGEVTFPAQARCPRCSGLGMAELSLPRRGNLVSWTTQGFQPSFDYMGDPTGVSFEPFGVGLVQLGGGSRLRARRGRDN